MATESRLIRVKMEEPTKPAPRWYDSPIAGTLISAVVAVAALAFSAYTHNQDSQDRKQDKVDHAAEVASGQQMDRAKKLQQDLTLVAGQFPDLLDSDGDKQTLAVRTITFVQQQYANDRDGAARTYFSRVLDIAGLRGGRAKSAQDRSNNASSVASTGPQTSLAPPTEISARTPFRIVTAGAAPPDPVTGIKPSRVFVQYFCKADAAAAGQVRAAFLAAGIPVPAPENVLSSHAADQPTHDALNRSALALPEVRFFSSGEVAAGTFAAQLLGHALGTDKAGLRDVSGRYGNVPAGQMEVWFRHAATDCPRE